LKLAASILTVILIVQGLNAREKNPWSVDHICGRVQYLQRIPIRKQPNNYSDKRKDLRGIPLELYESPEAAPCCDGLYHYRPSAYLLHEFVIMPDHFHALITPQTSLEKAVQFIKGGFSYRAKKELGSNMEVWQKGFQDHRIRDASDCAVHVSYIHNNPVKQHLCERADEFSYSSAHSGFELDAVPQGLKPQVLGEVAARLEGVPFQNKTSSRAETSDGAAKAAPFQSIISSGKDEAIPVPGKAKTA